jgi:tRNA(Ile)-lysidine synthase
MMLTHENFFKRLRAYTHLNEFCLAFSGGLDSSVLLHLFCQCRQQHPTIRLRAVHIHHGLSPHADQWAASCERVCHHYEVPIDIIKIAIAKNSQESLEELARNGRYQVFRELLRGDELLVTAHHQDDQAETVLLQLFRGAGPKGLAAMPIIAPFAKGILFRPLLAYQREQLKYYANSQQINWLEDESNQNLVFDRNFIREALLPLIKTRWPTISDNLMRVAGHCAQADKFIEKNIAHLFNNLIDPGTNRLAVEGLLSFDKPIQNYIIRFWLQYLNRPLPSTALLEVLHQEILACRQDANPIVRWKDIEIRRYHNYLYAMPPLKYHDPAMVISWDLNEDLVLPNDLGTMSLSSLKQQGLNPVDLDQVTIRFRQGGERCRLPNRPHSHSLKKLFQEWRVPPWQRGRIPLLYSKNKLRAIIGYAVVGVYEGTD